MSVRLWRTTSTQTNRGVCNTGSDPKGSLPGRAGPCAPQCTAPTGGGGRLNWWCWPAPEHIIYGRLLRLGIPSRAMQAIETHYAGHRFRSRIEARWAVFFDATKTPWQYEPEGFVLDSGRHYLPDFYLPRQRLWIEVKGNAPTDRDVTTWEEFCLSLPCENDGLVNAQFAALLYGPIPRYGEAFAYVSYCWGEEWANDYRWARCPSCGRIDLTIAGSAEYMWCCSERERDEALRVLRGGPSLTVLRSLDIARKARFEHGEVPIPTP